MREYGLHTIVYILFMYCVIVGSGKRFGGVCAPLVPSPLTTLISFVRKECLTQTPLGGS